MKISLEQYNIKYSIEEEREDLNIDEVLEHVVSLLRSSGYSESTIVKGFSNYGCIDN